MKCSICEAKAHSPEGWDWFTGTLPTTFYACPDCQKIHWQAVQTKYTLSRLPDKEQQ